MKYIDLFAGCGGLSLGLEAAGFELRLAVEKSPMAAETFYHNFIKRLESTTEWNNYCQMTINEQLNNKLIVNELEALLDSPKLMRLLKNENIDLIAGGPPCQGFSMAGKRNPKDARNQLPWQFLEMVETIQPKAVLIENVLGIKQNFNKHGEKAPIEEINIALKETKPGYVTQLIEINAMHYGVPQHRPRVMVLGLRSDIAKKLKATTTEGFWKSANDIENINNPHYIKPTLAPKTTHTTPRTVCEALADLCNNSYKMKLGDKTYNNPELAFAKKMRNDIVWLKHRNMDNQKIDELQNHNLRKHADEIKDRFRLYQIFQRNDISVKIFNIAANNTLTAKQKINTITDKLQHIKFPAKSPDGTLVAKNITDLAEQIMRLATKKHSQRPLKWDSPSPTVLSLPDDFVHPHEPRTMTVREMARLQSFPDNFIFRSKETTGSHRRRFEVPQYTQVGNAVPPLLAEAVGKNIAGLLQSANNMKGKK